MLVWDGSPFGEPFLRSGTFLRFVLFQERCDLCLAFVLGPAEWGGVPQDIPDVGAGATVEEQADDFDVAEGYGLVQRCGVDVASGRVVAVWLGAGVE